MACMYDYAGCLRCDILQILERRLKAGQLSAGSSAGEESKTLCVLEWYKLFIYRHQIRQSTCARQLTEPVRTFQRACSRYRSACCGFVSSLP